MIHALHHFIVVQEIAFDRLSFGPTCIFSFSSTPPLIAYSRFSPGLHAHRRTAFVYQRSSAYAASDSVVIVVEVRTHQVMFSYCREEVSMDTLAANFLKSAAVFQTTEWSCSVPETDPWVQGVQETEAVFGNQGTTVEAIPPIDSVAQIGSPENSSSYSEYAGSEPYAVS